MRHERKKTTTKKKKKRETKQRDTRTPNEVILQTSVTCGVTPLYKEVGPSSAVEERVCVVSKHGCYMFT